MRRDVAQCDNGNTLPWLTILILAQSRRNTHRSMPAIRRRTLPGAIGNLANHLVRQSRKPKGLDGNHSEGFDRDAL